MNYALIFAGGVGQRMKSKSKPKQFLNVHGKPIIVHTIEKFQECDEIDKIVVVCLESYIPYMKELTNKFSLTKVVSIVRGGETGQDSIYNGLAQISNFANDDDIVLIHDGVRPLIDDQTIKKNIESVKKNGSAVTVKSSIETIILVNDNNIVSSVEDRNRCMRAKAPQSFFFKDIFSSHQKAIQLGKHNFIDSVTLMQFFGYKIYTVEGLEENIKITTKMDFFMFKAMLDSKENEQIYND